MIRRPTFVILVLALFALSASGGEKDLFMDYYYSAKTLISGLSALTAEIERAGLEKGISSEKAESFIARLAKAREGFSSIITLSETVEEINEGYITFIDRTIIAVGLAADYKDAPTPEKRREILEAAEAAAELKKITDAELSSRKTEFGVN